jgi:hypothetical protein
MSVQRYITFLVISFLHLSLGVEAEDCVNALYQLRGYALSKWFWVLSHVNKPPSICPHQVILIVWLGYGMWEE